MQSGEHAFYGLPQRELLELLQVDKSTFHRWRTGKSKPPASAVHLARIWINGELIQGGPDWDGWRLRRGELWAPNGHSFTAGEVLAIPFWRSCARIKLQHSEPEQLRLALG